MHSSPLPAILKIAYSFSEYFLGIIPTSSSTVGRRMAIQRIS
jgi:hypothetical protein